MEGTHDGRLRLLLERTSAATGVVYFEALVRSCAEVLGVSRAFVAKIDHDGAELVTLACHPADVVAPRMVHGTALEGVVHRSETVTARDRDEPWLDVGEALVALPARGSDERTRAVLVVAGAIEDLEGTAELLAPFAARAGAELERIEEDEGRRARDARAFEKQRLERVASLAGGIAHDFNNVLVGILGNAELGLLRVGEDSRVKQHLEAIQRSSLRAAELTRQLLTYAGRTRYEVQPLRMGEVIAELDGLFVASGNEQARIEYSLEPSLPSVLADRGKISQLLVTLVTNAVEAAAERQGTVRVTAKRATAEALTGDFRPDGPDHARAYVEIAITDDGPGMSDATRSHLFEPFFTTKAASGRGLGLAAALGVVAAHEGRIAVESEEGRGTTVRVLLPAAVSRPATPRPPAIRTHATPVPYPRSAWAGSALPSTGASLRSFLVVDDDPTVREITRVILEGGGFTVETAHDGASAIVEFDTFAKTLVGIVLDLRMPRIRGVEVMRHVRRSHPNLPIVVITAFPDELAALPADLHVRVVPKPFVAGELLDAVKALTSGGDLPATPR